MRRRDGERRKGEASSGESARRWVFLPGFHSLFESHVKPEALTSNTCGSREKDLLMVCFAKTEK